jgi:hypothetical protein
MTRSLLASVAVVALAACGGEGQADTPSREAGSAASVQTQTQAGGQAVAVTRTFGDWMAVCDNGNNCAAYGGNQESGPGWVIVKLEAGPGAEPQALFGAWTSHGEPVRIAIDGAAVASGDRPSEEHDSIAAGVPQDIKAFVDRIGQGQSATLTGGDLDEPQAIPLRGAAAAFLWIDERQGRLNTTTALIRRGSRPASAVPPPPALPAPRAAPAVSQEGVPGAETLPAALEGLAAVKTCREDTRRRDDQVHRLSGGQLLWSVLCFEGAYNTGHRFFLSDANGRSFQPILLPSPEPTSTDVPHEDRYVEINAEYDPETRTISSFSKGRGLGDCGAATTWVWTGRAFELKSEQRMDLCAGLSPDLWPTTWRTR